VLVTLGALFAGCSDDGAEQSSASPDSTDRAGTSAGEEQVESSATSATTVATTRSTRAPRTGRPTTPPPPTTAAAPRTQRPPAPPSPRALVVRDTCSTLRSASYLAAKHAVTTGRRRFANEGGTRAVETRLRADCPAAFLRYERVDALANSANRVIDEVAGGLGFLDAIGCIEQGMSLQVTNRTDRTIGALVFAKFDKGRRTIQGSPPVVVWRLRPGESRQFMAPTGPRAAGYRGPCSAVAVPWLARENPTTTATFPLDGDGSPKPQQARHADGIPVSVRRTYMYRDRFECSGARELLQGVADVRSGSFDRRRSKESCIKGERRLFVCRNVERSGPYAVVQVKLAPARVAVNGRLRREPRKLMVGVLRRSPQDRRWRWVVEPRPVGSGPDVHCSVPALPIGEAPRPG